MRGRRSFFINIHQDVRSNWPLSFFGLFLICIQRTYRTVSFKILRIWLKFLLVLMDSFSFSIFVGFYCPFPLSRSCMCCCNDPTVERGRVLSFAEATGLCYLECFSCFLFILWVEADLRVLCLYTCVYVYARVCMQETCCVCRKHA